jgi:hypothetical protein
MIKSAHARESYSAMSLLLSGGVSMYFYQQTKKVEVASVVVVNDEKSNTSVATRRSNSESRLLTTFPHSIDAISLSLITAHVKLNNDQHVGEYGREHCYPDVPIDGEQSARDD